MSRTLTETSQQYPRTVDLTENERHRLLAASRRRETLAALVDEQTPIELSRLALAVATREGFGADETAVERVAVSLHHAHLPLMAELGVVDYDPDANVVET